jgi:hypothetical protein
VGSDDPQHLIKIGYSRRRSMRVSEISIWCPYPVMLLAETEGPLDLEAWFHAKLQSDRSHGEWFRPTKAVRQVIKEINESGKVIGQPNYVRPFNENVYVSNFENVMETLGVSVTRLATALGIAYGSLASHYHRHTTQRDVSFVRA